LKIELITIGDEILLGHTLDTNSNWIASRLSECGFHLRWISVVADNVSDMRHQLRRAWNRADVVLVTGGLGPTHDDITRPVIADFFKDELIARADLAEWIHDRFAQRGLKPPPGYELMSEFPSRAVPILNEHGCAPGIHYSLDDRELIAMPGVPTEMHGMLIETVLPLLESRREGHYRFTVLKTAGAGESFLSEKIGDPNALEPVHLAYLPSIDHGVTVRLSLSGSDLQEVDNTLKKAEESIRDRIGEFIYATGSTILEEVILNLLVEKKMRLALAESCTGGLVTSRIVSVPGSSEALERAFVTYSNKSKIEVLGIDEEILIDNGAVSSETAVAMAEGARQRADVDIAVSVTGIAGPTGGTDEKPVGLVYIAIADKRGTSVNRFRFGGGRDANRRRAAHTALVMLWQRLKDD